MGHFDYLPTLTDRERQACPKPLPTPLRKAERIKTKKQQEKDFRLAVWTRDKGKSRASGKPLGRSGTNWERVGEVHHVIPRSLAPERVYDVANGLLLSKQEHALAGTNCPHDATKCLLDISGPEDRSEPQTFIWRDVNGTEVRRRVG
jgi:hypothetical protein